MAVEVEPEKPKKLDRIGAPGPLAGCGAPKVEAFPFFNIFSCKTFQKTKGGPFGEGEQNIQKKSPTMPKKTIRGDPLGFCNICSVAKHQKIEGMTLWGFLLETNSRSAEKH